MPTTTRRTRFVCISDTHNSSPQSGFRLPDGDVLVHAGDLTKAGSRAELERALAWIEAAAGGFQAKIVVAGNHDVGLDPESAEREGASGFLVTAEEIRSAFPSVTYLCHEYTVVTLPGPPCTTFRVFGSPRSPAPGSKASGSFGAFQYSSAPLRDGDARAVPPSIAASSSSPQPDSLLHTFGNKDDPSDRPEGVWSDVPSDTDVIVTHTPPRGHLDRDEGCPDLRQALARVRPRLHVCGHVHAARGADWIRWNGGGGIEMSREETTWTWTDGTKGTKKQSSIDLTPRAKGKAAWIARKGGSPGEGVVSSAGEVEAARPLETMAVVPGRDTCVVNASIMARSWPYPKAGERFNKPIVVDLDLPVLQ